MKGVVLCPKADRHPLARATNTNEAALIRGIWKESMAVGLPAAQIVLRKVLSSRQQYRI